MLEKSEESEFIQAKDYVDSQGYWITPDREIKRMGNYSDEQATVIQATAHCSDAEWTRFYSAIVACLDATKA